MSIHQTTIIEGENILGRNSLVGPFCTIKDLTLGAESKLFKYVNAYNCQIGERCKIGSFVEIQGGAKIGNEVTISSHTFICDRVTIDDGAWVGHGVVTINDLYPPSKKRTGSDEYWGSTYIGKRTIIGSNATIFPIRVGDQAVVGAGAVVRRDVPPGQVWAGNPARYICDIKDLKYKNGKPVFPN